MKIKVVPNPNFDFFVGYIGGPTIPTKQDKFKPLNYLFLAEKPDSTLEFFNPPLYILNDAQRASQAEFEKGLKDLITEQLTDDHPYKDTPLEVIISVSMNAKRLKEVDIDNLVKSILDCFTGLVFQDDSMVHNLIATKKAISDNGLPQLNGILIGIRKLTPMNGSLLGDLSFYEFQEIND